MDSLASLPFPVLIVLALSAAAAVGVLFWRVEDRLVEERKKAARLNSVLNDSGHTLTAKIREALAVGDLPAVWAEIDSLLKELADPKTAPALLQADLLNQLTRQLANAEAAPAILKTVAAFVAAHPALAKAAGLAIVAL